MKFTLFVALIALAVSYSAAVKVKGSSCPTPYQPKVDYWDFSNFQEFWYVIGRTDETYPRTVYNTIEIDHVYPGKVAVLSKGNTRDISVLSQWDKLIEMTVGDFNGKSYYDYNDDPYFFNITTSDGHRGTFWMPYYYRSDYTEAILLSCAQIDEKTIDAKAWYVSTQKSILIPSNVQKLVNSLIGLNLKEVCQGDFC